jgi:hypothetical protein
MHTVYRALAVVLLSTSAVAAQVHPRVNRAHPLAEGLLQWHIAAPFLTGGPQWYNLMGTRHGTLTNMTAGFGWVSTHGGISPGALSCDGTDDYVAFPATTAFDFVDTTFTVSARFRGVTTAAAQVLLGNRDVAVDTAGSFNVRLNADGTLLAGTRSPAGNVAVRLTNGTYGDDAWHTFNISFTTDTVTSTNNSVTIYVDGVLDQTALQQFGTTYSAPVTTVGLCTASGNVPSNYFAGALDNVMIHGRDLTAAGVSAYQQMRWPTYGGLLLPHDVTTLPLALIPARPKRKVVIQ